MIYPIKQVLRKPKLTGMVVAWSIELLEFDLYYEPRGPIKTQSMASFLKKFAGNEKTTPDWLNLYIDGASNVKGNMAGIIIEGLDNVPLEQALKLNFKASNNQAEYEALIASLKLAT